MHKSVDYLTLRASADSRGVLAKTPGYYILTTVVLITLMSVAWFAFYALESTAARMLLLFAMGILGVHFGFLGHDAGHRAISRRQRINNILGAFGMTFINGVSFSYWNRNHNAHHKDPNFDPGDPDIDYLISFNEEQVRKRGRILRALTPYQAFYFVPIQSLTAFSMLFNSVRHLIKRVRGATLPIESLLLVCHVCLWVVAPCLYLGLGYGLLFYAFTGVVRGLYFSLVFVPNHVGMPTFKPHAQMSYVEKQVITARNITPSWFKDWLFGGLNYQIEHHLFPSISRKNLRPCTSIVREFCAKHKLHYENVGFFRCYANVFSHLHRVGRLARLTSSS